MAPAPMATVDTILAYPGRRSRPAIAADRLTFLLVVDPGAHGPFTYLFSSPGGRRKPITPAHSVRRPRSSSRVRTLVQCEAARHRRSAGSARANLRPRSVRCQARRDHALAQANRSGPVTRGLRFLRRPCQPRQPRGHGFEHHVGHPFQSDAWTSTLAVRSSSGISSRRPSQCMFCRKRVFSSRQFSSHGRLGPIAGEGQVPARTFGDHPLRSLEQVWQSFLRVEPAHVESQMGIVRDVDRGARESRRAIEGLRVDTVGNDRQAIGVELGDFLLNRDTPCDTQTEPRPS